MVFSPLFLACCESIFARQRRWHVSGNRVSASCLQLVADNRNAKCAGNYRVAGSSPALPVRRQVTQPGRVCKHFLHPCWRLRRWWANAGGTQRAPFVFHATTRRRTPFLLRKNEIACMEYKREVSPAPATRRQGSSAVEHENVSPTLVARTPANAEGITWGS